MPFVGNQKVTVQTSFEEDNPGQCDFHMFKAHACLPGTLTSNQYLELCSHEKAALIRAFNCSVDR